MSVDGSATHAAVDGHGQENSHAGAKKATTLGKTNVSDTRSTASDVIAG
jgi:hypothetical protein